MYEKKTFVVLTWLMATEIGGLYVYLLFFFFFFFALYLFIFDTYTLLYLFISFWLRWVFVAARGLSLQRAGAAL